jgi:hypothetical protein
VNVNNRCCEAVIYYRNVYLGQEYFGRGDRTNEWLTFFPYTTRNAKIPIIHYATNIFLRKLHRSISGGQLSLISLSQSLLIVVVEV